MIQPSFLRLLGYLLVFIVFFLPPVDTDLGWHLRYGNFMLENQKLFIPNQLTYFLPDYIWPNSYTLYQILTTTLSNLGGFFALSLAYGALGVLSFWLFQKISPKNFLASLIIYLSIVYFSWVVFNLGWRAQVASFTFLIATFLVVKQVFAHKTFPKLFPLLFILWANLHGGFVLGLFVQAAALLQSIFTKDKKSIFSFLALLVTSALATFINPYGPGIHKEVLNHLQTPLGGIIAEWTPADWWHTAIILGTTPLLLFFAYQRKKNPFFWTILLIASGLMAISAKRNLGIWSLFAGICLLEIWKEELEQLTKKIIFSQVAIFALVVIGVSVVATTIPRTLDLAFNWQSYCAKGLRIMPCSAAEYIQKNPQEGKNVFSSYEWGGFIAWQLPQYKYFVDGRMPAWTVPSPYTTHLEILRTEGNFLQNLEDYQTDWLLIPAGTYLDIYLTKNQTVWHEKYRDKTAVVYTKL